ncbi:salicylate synthase [Burkholderia anthina]|uniref:salicylate synthase n=1 Tax=Burkholderia anthina TaxID=179879 RepID=UPI00299EB84C|nr:salicylate synthase [Burkholderia anthina]
MNASAVARNESSLPRHDVHGDWQRVTLGERLREWAARHGERVALVDGAARCSYAELDRRADRLAAGLVRLGVTRGDVVLLQLPNGTAFVATLFALLRIGALPLLAMPSQRLADLESFCTRAAPVACVMPDRFLGFDYRPMAQTLRERCPSLRHVLIDGDAGPHAALAALDDGSPAPYVSATAVDPDDVALLLQSGGTTGAPKLIPRTHADYGYNALASARLCGMDAETVYLAALPIAHNFPLACPGLIGTLATGGRVVMARTPGSDEAFPLIERERVTMTALVPQLVRQWLQARDGDAGDLSSLTLLQVGGARLEADIAQRVAPAFGCTLQQVFGMAEGLLCYTRPGDGDDIVLHTQGRPLSPDDEIRIVDANGADVAPGETGELLTRGPYTIRGYWRGGSAEAAAFTAAGFYRSGDLVRLTPDGNLIVEGRLKEQINRAGEKIAIAEIEKHLRAHPAIDDAVVVAVADPVLGERSCAFVIAPTGAPNLRELHHFLRERGLARHKLPDQIETADTWPLTKIGKVDRRRLAGQAATHRGDRDTCRAAYRERTVATTRHALPMAVAIARDLDEASYTVYERDGEWSIGIGVLAEVRVDARRATLSYRNEDRSWPLDTVPAAVSRALADWPVDGYRLYGTADFELARELYGLPSTLATRPLLQLIAPVVELRVHDGAATIRAVDDTLIDEWISRLARIDAAAGDLSGTDTTVERQGVTADIAGADAEPYRQRVARSVAQIDARDYDKVIVSRAVPVDGMLDLPASYLKGRRANQPARSFLLRRDGFESAGFSPETVVEVAADGLVSTQPLAGTRALGDTPDDEARLRADLLRDPKEIAEHAVSVKLAVDELLPICAPGTVNVAEFMQVCRRGTVQHLGSRVRGRLAAQRSAWDAFAALFPAVTASGIPKRHAIDAIGRLEPGPRGLYSGCVLIADSDGALDAALVLRSMFVDGGRAWLQAGAGVVAMSTPERELEETREKLTSVSRFLAGAEVRA